MDISTVLMILAAEAFTVAILLWSRWFYEREPHALIWGGGFAIQSIGVALIWLEAFPTFVSVHIANALIFIGVGLWIAGLLNFDGKKIRAYAAIPLLIWLGGALFLPVGDHFASRVLLHLVAATPGYAILIALLLRNTGPSKITRRFLAGFIALQFAASSVLAILCVISNHTTFSPTTKNAWLFLLEAFCFIAAILSGAKLLSERSELKLKALALTDPLTDALNRRGLIDAFHDLRKADRPDKPLIAFLHFDLDNFKQINDRCGHYGGDMVLVAFAKTGLASLRGCGSFGRMGGEEFASILRVADVAQATGIAEATRLALKRQMIAAGDHQVNVTVSAGIAFAEIEAADIDLLFQAADRALYKAKRGGRDQTALNVGGEITVIPAIDRLAETEERRAAAEAFTNSKIATLKRVATFSKS